MSTLRSLFRNRVAPWWAALSAPLLVFAVYWPGVDGGFVFDDFPNLVDNASLRVTGLQPSAWIAAAFSSEAGTLQRPLSMLSFAANHVFTGLDPVAMKWTNIAIHAMNAFLAFGLVRTLLLLASPQQEPAGRKRTAAFVATAWAVHPINFLAVLYIVQRMESLAHLFVLGGLWMYLAGRCRQLRDGGGVVLVGVGLVGGTALGLLCKESAALLPLYAWLAEMCLPQLRDAPDRRRVQWMFAAMLWLPAVAGVAWLLPRALSAGAFSTRDFDLAERLMTEGRVVLDYLRWTIAPPLGELSLYHDDYAVSRGWLSPPSTLFAVLALVGLAAGAWWLRRRRPLAALGLLWFLAAQAMTATIVPLELVFEHRNYFASLGVCLALADVLLVARLRVQWLGWALAGIALVAFAATTHLRAREWSDPYRLVRTEAAKRPQSPRSAYALGQMLVVLTRYQADSPFVPRAQAALEHARSLPGSGILPHSALLLLAAHTGQPQREEWWLDMRARLRKGPVGPQEIGAVASLSHCARDHKCDFPPRQLVGTFEAALSRPNAEMLNLYADYAFNVLRRPDDAIRMWREAIALKPKIAQYRINLVKVLIAEGRFGQAAEGIGALRGLGRFGQYETEAAALEERLRQASRAR